MKKFRVKTFRKGGWIRSRDEEFIVYAERYIIKDNTVTFICSEQYNSGNDFFRHYDSSNDLNSDSYVASFCASEYTVILTDQVKMGELFESYKKQQKKK